MSGASCCNFPVETPKNILWVDTYYNSLPYNIANMSTKIIWKSEKFKIPYIDILLEFQFLRYTELEFRLTCIRTSSAPDFAVDYGYHLQFHCSISIFDDDPKVFEMFGGQTIAFETFWLNAAYRQCFSSCYIYKQFELKILVKLIEYDILPTYVHLRQEDDFFEMKEKFFNSESVLKDLEYILKCPNVQGIFTGRLDYEFAELKSNYIKRTATFSKEIADYLRAKDEFSLLPVTDLAIILNYILNEEKTAISNKDLIIVYFEGYHMGLGFLADLSRDCILERIRDKKFVVDAIQAAERANDEILFEKVAQNFHSWEKEILNTEKWQEMLKYSNVHYRFIVHSLKRRLRIKELQNRAQAREPLASSSLKVF